MSISFNHLSRYVQTHPLDIQAIFRALPLVITSVFAKGKKIVILFENDTALVSCLGTKGRWLCSPQNNSGLSIVCSDGTNVYYDDSLRQGMLEVTTTKQQLAERLSRIGPDLLSNEVSEVTWLQTMRSPSLREKEVCAVLMDQSIFSGIGNYGKAEILHYARIRPNARVVELTDEMLVMIFRWSVWVLRTAYAQGGANLSGYINFFGQRGEFHVGVYEQKKCPYGKQIIDTTFSDDRTTWWAPEHQVFPSLWAGPDPLNVQRFYADDYKLSELRNFCMQYSLPRSGNKGQLRQRLLGILSGR